MNSESVLFCHPCLRGEGVAEAGGAVDPVGGLAPSRMPRTPADAPAPESDPSLLAHASHLPLPASASADDQTTVSPCGWPRPALLDVSQPQAAPLSQGPR